MKLIPSGTLWGSWAQKSFCAPPFLDYRKQASFGLHDLPWDPRSRSKHLLIGEGRGCRDKIVKRNSSAALGQSPGSPSTDTRSTIFELFCRYWNSYQVGEVNSMLPTHTPQTSWNQKVDDVLSHLPHHQPVRGMSVNLSCPLLIITIKLLTTTHSFEGFSPLWPLLPGKAIKLFFSTSPKTLSLRINSVLRYKGWIWLQEAMNLHHNNSN